MDVSASKIDNQAYTRNPSVDVDKDLVAQF